MNAEDKVRECTENQLARSIPLPDSSSLPSSDDGSLPEQMEYGEASLTEGKDPTLNSNPENQRDSHTFPPSHMSEPINDQTRSASTNGDSDISNSEGVQYDRGDIETREPRVARNIIHSRDDFMHHHDNLAFSVTVKNQPLCTGAKKLQDEGRLPKISDVVLGKVKITNISTKHKIALAVKENLHIRTDPKIFKETLASLLDAVNTLQLQIRNALKKFTVPI